MSLPVIVVGAGGHAAVVADALLTAGHTVLGFTDGSAARHGQSLCGLPVLGDDSVLAQFGSATLLLANGIGLVDAAASPLRRRLQEMLERQGWRFCSVIHPSAVISRFARLGHGVQLMAGSVVQAGADIGPGCIVNTRAVVDHDARIGAWSHVAPGAVVCGNTSVGESSHVGAGATLRQGLVLGRETLVGAGAVVIKSFGGQGALVGVPAHPLEPKK